jgi:hypothetical protein
MAPKVTHQLFYTIFFGTAFALFLSFGLTTLAMAAERAVFHVEGVEIDARADDELAAKSQGLAAGKQTALKLLLERLCSTADYDRLPDANAKTLNSMVRDLSLAGERFGGGRYLAHLTVRFNPTQVRALLRRANIPFAETKSRPILVLPVHQNLGAELLWDNPNPWFDAWRSALLNDPQKGQSLLPLTLPRGDFSDLTVISAAQAARGTPANLKAIMGKYGAAGVLVPVATAGASIGEKGAAATLTISILRFGGDLENVVAPPAPLKLTAAPNETQPDFLTRAAAQIVRNTTETWKQANLLVRGGEQKLQVIAPFANFKDWLTLRRQLDRVSSLTTISVSRLSIREATLALRFRGDPSQLKTAMAQRNLNLSYSNDDSAWLLQLQ